MFTAASICISAAQNASGSSAPPAVVGAAGASVAGAWGARGDLPAAFDRLHGRARVPVAAVVGVALAIAALALTGSVETTWAFSAFAVLVYYAITNLAALRLPVADRRYPPAFAVAGLLACVFLAFQLPVAIWTSGLALIGIGLAWHWIAMRRVAR